MTRLQAVLERIPGRSADVGTVQPEIFEDPADDGVDLIARIDRPARAELGVAARSGSLAPAHHPSYHPPRDAQSPSRRPTLAQQLPAIEKQIPRTAVPRLRSHLEAASDAAFKITFATLLVGAALGFTYTAPDASFPLAELRAVLARVMAVSGLLFVVALALPRSRGISNAALALATLAGVFTVYLVHTELFQPSNRVWLVMVLAACLFALFTAFRVIDEIRWAGFALAIATALAIAAIALPEVVPKLRKGMSTPGGVLDAGSPARWAALGLACAGSALALYALSKVVPAYRWGALALLAAGSILAMSFAALGFKFGEGGSGYHADGWEDHPKLRSVEFGETPNLYFVGFDSIIPEAVMRKHMGIGATDFHRLTESEMRRFPNLFANAVPTKHSINTMMALDQDIYLEHRDAAARLPGYFAGHDLSPLVWLLRHNGYETTSIYQNTHFGYTRGPGVDNYAVQRKGALCWLLDESIVALAFWGYCWSHQSERASASEPRSDFLVRHLSGVDRGSPQFVIAVSPLPGHTPKIFDPEDRGDRRRFLWDFERNFNKAAVTLEKIIRHLRTNDPDAILFVFGDHGAWLSRGLDVEDDPAFFLRDRFAILGGVYPPDRCAAELDEAERKGYVTSLDVVHAIVLCLSDGRSPLLEPRRDRFWPLEPAEDHAYGYEEFLYE